MRRDNSVIRWWAAHRHSYNPVNIPLCACIHSTVQLGRIPSRGKCQICEIVFKITSVNKRLVHFCQKNQPSEILWIKSNMFCWCITSLTCPVTWFYSLMSSLVKSNNNNNSAECCHLFNKNCVNFLLYLLKYSTGTVQSNINRGSGRCCGTNNQITNNLQCWRNTNLTTNEPKQEKLGHLRVWWASVQLKVTFL